MRPQFPTLALALAILALPSTVVAQAPSPGTWSGSISDPQGNSKPVTYTVAGSGDSLSITLVSPARQGSIPFAGLRFVADTLSFTWAGGRRGAPLACTLVRQANGTFEGKCHDPDGQEGLMTMVPPPKQ